MTHKHTPGPWAAEYPDRIVSAAPGLFDTTPSGAVESLLIATVRCGLTVAEQETTGCSGGNMRLLAAAPELLAACEGAVDLIEAWRNGIIKRAGITWQSLDDAPPALKALHVVVAKAKGGAA